MSNSIFEKLNFTFDTDKFGDAQYLSPAAEAYLNAAPLRIDPWMQSDIANGNIQMTNYYKNPTTNVVSYLTGNAQSMLTFLSTDTDNVFPSPTNTYVYTAISSLQGLLLQLSEFLSHTDNISGVTPVTSNTDIVPSLDSVTRVGNYLLRIVNTTDGVTNTTPMLGSLTSLFINDELSANSNTIYLDNLTLQNSYNLANNISNVTSNTINTIIYHVNTANSLLYTRRTDDWNFYSNSNIIVNDYMSLYKFTNMGSTQTYLAKNMIGTDRLIANLEESANIS